MYTAEPPEISTKIWSQYWKNLTESRVEAAGSNDPVILSVKNTQALARILGDEAGKTHS